jgi:hypothetical protein
MAKVIALGAGVGAHGGGELGGSLLGDVVVHVGVVGGYRLGEDPPA